MKISSRKLKLVFLFFLVFLFACNQLKKDKPVIWTSYSPGLSRNASDDSAKIILDRDLKDMKDHRVDLIEFNSSNKVIASSILDLAKKHDLKLSVRIGSDPNVSMVERERLKPEYALMIGGVYNGKAIDRHLFEFSADKQSIIIEPPVYNSGFAYIDNNTGKPCGHYYPGIQDPVKAEIVIPIKPFNGQQHLIVIPATVEKISGSARLGHDSATPEMQSNPEIMNRNLYKLSFDLSEYPNAMLDKIGIAVYWEYHGYRGTWYMFSEGQVSVCSETTKEAIRKNVRDIISFWSEANNGTFPKDQIYAGRWGDENFYLTGHLNNASLSVNYPIWDYSESFIKEYGEKTGGIQYPRTWGFPEIYGEDAYAWWRYLLHEKCAELVDIVKEEVAKVDNQFFVYRNTTRNGVFALPNEFDGSGPELLTQHLDLVHLDPYPVMRDRYEDNILIDMGYYSGLARRYHKPLLPWVQAITDEGTLKNNGSMRHPTPDQLVRMINEHRLNGVDGIMYLGYGPGRNTFPSGNPDTWEKAREVHNELKRNPPAKPKVRLAVVRPYSKRALVSITDGLIKNPADYYLQLFLNVWSVDYKQAYDVFELAPGLSTSKLDSIKNQITGYHHIVSSAEWENALIIGKDLDPQIYSNKNDNSVKEKFRQEIEKLGWVKQ